MEFVLQNSVIEKTHSFKVIHSYNHKHTHSYHRYIKGCISHGILQFLPFKIDHSHTGWPNMYSYGYPDF